MLERRRLASVVLWFSALLFGCAAPAQEARPGLSAAPSPTGTNSFPSGGARRLRARRLDFPIEFNLPGKLLWLIDERATWLTLAHAPSASRLSLRTWRAERLVRREDCVTQAWLSRPSLPVVREEALIERRPIAAPAGFDSELVVGVEPDNAALAGYALVFGASVGRCYAAVFTTRVSGMDADKEVAARLAVIVDQVFGSVRLLDVDERAVRRRLIATPRPAPD